MIKLACLGFVVAALVPAAAHAGGMGDSAAWLRQMNAICEAQKRGEGPLSPNLCLPDYPAAEPYASAPRKRK